MIKGKRKLYFLLSFLTEQTESPMGTSRPINPLVVAYSKWAEVDTSFWGNWISKNQSLWCSPVTEEAPQLFSTFAFSDWNCLVRQKLKKGIKEFVQSINSKRNGSNSRRKFEFFAFRAHLFQLSISPIQRNFQERGKHWIISENGTRTVSELS